MKYLIVGPSWVGDMVMAQVLFRLLKQLMPEAMIDVIAPGWSQPLLARMPEISRGLTLPVTHGELALKKRFRFGRSLVESKYDQAILLPNSFKSALVPFWAKIPVRTGWKGEFRYGLLNDIRKLSKQHYPLMTEQFAALALSGGQSLPDQLPVPSLVADKSNAEQAKQRFQLITDRPILALCPGAEFGPAKRWPERHYSVVASDYIKKGWQVWMFGSQKDITVVEAIKEYLPIEQQKQAYNLAGKTSLGDAIDLLSLTDAVVSNDSGLMHISAALKLNLVAVYGSSSPAFTPPLNENKIILRLGLDCSPCFKRECPLHHLNCLEKLEPARVIDALAQLVGESVNIKTSESVSL